MADAARSAESRKALLDLLEADGQDDETWFARARAIGEGSGLPVYSEMMRRLTHLRFSDSDAEGKWREIRHHRAQMSSRLGRDVGLRLAAFDWFVNIEPRLKNPKVLEMAQFERTERSAMTDWLTGLNNRGAFRGACLRELRRAQRYRQQASFLLFDLDDFKDVNDRNGHDTGDLVLRETSRLLCKSIRDVDTCARYGGEEFAVLFPETGRSGAAAVAERIRAAMVDDFAVADRDGSPIVITVSGGISVYPEDGEEFGDLMRKADSALYQAKTSGKNRIVHQFVERRQARRFARTGRTLGVTLSPAGETRQLPAKARDISRLGIGVTVEERFVTGQDLRLSLEGAGGRKQFELRGRVVYSAELAGPSGRPVFDLGIGLEKRSWGAAAAAMEALEVAAAPAPGQEDDAP